jgi:GTP-binding protein
MKIETARFIMSASTFEACPESKKREFAMVGRSNVGKSSLINMLTGKKELAKTSSVPGRTQTINFFAINETWDLIDLPGYGYAKTSKAMRSEFNVHVSAYLTSRENLEHVFVLVDAELKPQESDLDFIEWMQEAGIAYSVIFTKTDKLTDLKVKAHAQDFRERLADRSLEPTQMFNCSSKTSRGKGPILQFIQSRLPKVKPKAKSSTPTMNLSWMQKK